ncbi:hypothetical protein GCM10008107_32010 [Psychrosphaera saromensis]|uniref:Uncharacterized protein n=1 Tax=Psychrosphaera saromensis TaxID=716813 RepID=A0A2S7UWN0_9GAMM|nr:hypothetical protein [Psychrosphaera saromensis]PQJ54115.1 hypothetical protein BTO11_10935 [Psychrosphaera saromensis]GHB80222.1 hypothetical protein GCM10008107_32010 [Psychrosphaera saromensis]GLQ15214.1 hypothetical protein GCM10007917_26690 [Psychrosphaera saromensis]
MAEKILIAFIASVFSAFVAWSIALRRHRKTQFWNKKLEVYTSTLSCLHELKKVSHQILDDTTKKSSEEVAALIKNFNNQKHDLHKYRDLGYLLISDEAEESLVWLIVNLEVSADSHQIVTSDLETDIEVYEADENLLNIDKCISLFKDAAKDDLQV